MRFKIDGSRFDTLHGFFDVAGAALAPGHEPVRDLNGFDRLLRGGLGPRDEAALVIWQHSEKSRHDLGYPETLRCLEQRLLTCPHPQRAFVQADIAAAQLGKGPTVYNWVVDIIARHGPGGDDAQDDIRLILD